MRLSQTKNYSFSICMPVYKGSHVITNALRSLYSQINEFKYEIIIGDDTPQEFEREIKKTKDIINSYHDGKIYYFRNKKNLGYPGNLKKIMAKAKNDIVFLLAQDDILSRDALQRTNDAFLLDKDIGAVTRPYFWFEDDINKPVRVVPPIDLRQNVVLSLQYDAEKTVLAVFGSIGQLSGLAFRKNYIDTPPHEYHVFTTHMYPFASIIKKYKCVFLKDYTVAVGIKDSQTRHVSSIYDISPTEQWVMMFADVYKEKKFEKIRKLGIKLIATHFTGLVQIKNYGSMKSFFKEIWILLKVRPQNILEPKFWFYCILTVFTPKFLLRKLTDWYKRNILSKTLPKISFEYD